MKFTEEELTAFHVFFNKRPVNRPTSQTAASQAFEKIHQYFTEEENRELSIAWGHATFVNEGRREFDRVAKKIKERLGL
jgi:hypothetical protein